MKKRLYSFLEKDIGKRLGNYVSPNKLSVLSFFTICVSTLFYIKKRIILGGIFILISGIFDALDGTVARALKIGSKTGGYIDLYLDKLGETLMLLLFSYFQTINPIIGIFCVSGILLREFINLICKSEGIKSGTERFRNRGVVVSPRIVILLSSFYDFNIGFLTIGIAMWGLFLLDSFFWLKFLKSK